MRSICYLIALALTALFIVALLVYSADIPNKKKNGFSRQYIPYAVTPVARISTGGSIQDICGATATQFYFSTNDPEKLVTTGHALENKKILSLHIDKTVKDAMGQFFFTETDTAAVHIYAYNLPAIITASLQTDSVTTQYLPAGGYSQAHAFSDHNFILRKLDLQLPDQLFMRFNSLTGDIHREKNLSEIHHDGGMCTDGMLHYDKTTGLFTYLYYYNNRYFSFDSSLNLYGNGHTIDTFKHFRFVLSDRTAAKEHVFTSQGPDKMVNAVSCVYKGALFVRSTLKADNDDDNAYRNNVVIDVYNLQTGSYQGSFYLPVNNREKINKLAIYDDVLLVLYKEQVYAWRINASSLFISKH